MGARPPAVGSPPLLEVRGLHMRFGEVVALADVSLTIEAGSVLCLLGDNGAGKSTLIGILTGVHRPTAGEYRMEGAPLSLPHPRAAADRGIAAVHQDLGLLPLLSVWRNFFLGREPVRGRGPLRRLDIATCKEVAARELRALGIQLRDPGQAVGTLSGGERQSVAIARALHFGARVLILDEPTAALGVRQTAMVLDAIGRARDRGVAVVFVTHNPLQAYPIGDHYAVLRHGRLAALEPRDRVGADRLVRLMAGEAA